MQVRLSVAMCVWTFTRCGPVPQLLSDIYRTRSSAHGGASLPVPWVREALAQGHVAPGPAGRLGR